MLKIKKLSCPLCGTSQVSVKNCKDLEVVCSTCGCSLLITKKDDGSCIVSARPQGYQQCCHN